MKATGNSIEVRIQRFYEANPDEELTPEMLSVKFGCKVVSVRQIMSRLKKTGYPLERVSVWRMKGASE